ncbi:PAS domain-containing protein [Pectobacteriaceae bacterium CE90]|nr:PAS domain-containing protein [Pectobacteriaceae bacterium CE90]
MQSSEKLALLTQISCIAQGLSDTFAPFCEVVVHDLKNPQHAILEIYNSLSGREVGEPATELGLARIGDPDYPQVIANYANQFVDGRPVKSTSIGIKDENGQYVAALCINVDMTMFRSVQNALAQFSQRNSNAVTESLEPAGTEAIRQRIDQFAARLASTPRALKAPERRQLILELRDSGLLDVKRSMDTIAQHLGISRASAYSYAK